MTRVEKEGFTAVYHAGSGTRWDLLTCDVYPSLCEALRRGDPWFEARGVYGGSVFVRLADVVSVTQDTPAVRQEFMADQRAAQQAHDLGLGE